MYPESRPSFNSVISRMIETLRDNQEESKTVDVRSLFSQIFAELINPDIFKIQYLDIPVENVNAFAHTLFASQRKSSKLREDLQMLSNQYKFVQCVDIVISYSSQFSTKKGAIQTNRADHLYVCVENNGRIWLFSSHQNAAVIDQTLFTSIREVAHTDDDFITVLAAYITETTLIEDDVQRSAVVAKVINAAAEAHIQIDRNALQSALQIGSQIHVPPVHCYAPGIPYDEYIEAELTDILIFYFHFDEFEKQDSFRPYRFFHKQQQKKPANFQDLIRQTFHMPAYNFYGNFYQPPSFVIREWIDIQKKERLYIAYICPEAELKKLSPMQIALLIIAEWLEMNDYLNIQQLPDIVSHMLHLEGDKPSGYTIGLLENLDKGATSELYELIAILREVENIKTSYRSRRE